MKMNPKTMLPLYMTRILKRLLWFLWMSDVDLGIELSKIDFYRWQIQKTSRFLPFLYPTIFRIRVFLFNCPWRMSYTKVMVSISFQPKWA